MSVGTRWSAVKTDELDVYIAPDGARLVLSAPPDRMVLTEEGTGIPPITYVTQRGPYQHGETLRDFFLLPRVVQMVIRHQFCSRADYWAGRAHLLDLIRPNRGGNPGQGVLHKVLPGNIQRDLCCVIQQGPNFAPRSVGIGGSNAWDEWAFTETLRFVANDPTYYDPIQQDVQFALTDAGTFPMTFPVVFTGFLITQTIQYAGNWHAYPTITLTGPLSMVTITNVTTGKQITLNYALAAGRTVTLALGYGVKTVTLDDGSNLIGTVTSNSDLATFALEPGANVITVTGSDTGAGTKIEFGYFTRYIGI